MWNNSEVSNFVREISKNNSINEDNVMKMFLAEIDFETNLWKENGSRITKKVKDEIIKITISRIEYWLESNFLNEITPSHLASYRIPYLFFNCLKR